MKTITVLYHRDADGFASAYACWRKFGYNANYISVQYSEPVPDIPEGTETLYVVDFSYDRATCDDLAEKYDLTVFDHHKTAKANLEGADYAVFDSNKAGCGITWEQLHSATMPELLEYVQDRDLWKFDMFESEIVNLYISTLDWDFEVWDKKCRETTFFPTAVMIGMSLKKFRDGQIERAMKNTRFMVLTVDGQEHVVPVLNLSNNISEVGNEMCRKYAQYPFSVTYCDREEVRSWSLRSVGDFDVSAIAKAFGGGGHKNAAGFSTEIGWPEIRPAEFIRAFEEAATTPSTTPKDKLST